MDDSKVEPPDVSEIPIPCIGYMSADDEVYFIQKNHYNLEVFKLLLHLKFYNMFYTKFRTIPPPPSYTPRINPE